MPGDITEAQILLTLTFGDIQGQKPVRAFIKSGVLRVIVKI